jgi:hypothetical protein
VPAGKLRTPYRKRILAFCEREGIVVPRSFDIAKASDRLALIDLTTRPPTLVSRTTYLTKDVVRFLNRAENSGRQFRILDFRHGFELKPDEDGRLVRSSAFAHRAENELLYLVEP